MRQIDWTSPVPLFGVIASLGVLVPIIPFLRAEDSFSVIWPFSFFSINRTLLTALTIYAVIFVLFVLGYRIGKNKNYSVDCSIKIMHEYFYHRAFFFIIIGTVAFVTIVYLAGGLKFVLEGASDRTRAFAGLQGFFLVMNILLTLGLVWFVRFLRRPTLLSEKIVFAAYCIFMLGLISLQGQKSNLFIFIAAIAVIGNVKIRRASLPEILLGVILLFIGLMSFHIYKQEYLAVGRVVSLGSGAQFWSSVYEFMRFQFFGNFMQLQTMCVLLEGTPLPLGFQYGYSYLAGLLLLVPRALFPDKPLPTTGIFTEAYWPEMWREQGTTLPPGLFGEAYLNFGVFGAFAMALLFGGIYGRLHGKTEQRPFDDLALIQYAVAVASLLHFFRGELSSVLYLALSIALPARFFMSRVRS